MNEYARSPLDGGLRSATATSAIVRPVRSRVPAAVEDDGSAIAGWTLDDLRWATINAMKSAFVPFDERLTLIDEVIKPGYAELTEAASDGPGRGPGPTEGGPPAAAGRPFRLVATGVGGG